MNTDCADRTDEESVLIRAFRVQKDPINIIILRIGKNRKNVKNAPSLLKHLKTNKMTKHRLCFITAYPLVLYKTATGCCPLVVRLMSACCPLLKRTTSGHQADNKRTTTSVDLYRVLLRGGECRIGFLLFFLAFKIQ